MEATARVVSGFDSTAIGLSRDEMKGLLEQRRLLKDLKRRGDERCEVVWRWHGDELHCLKLDYTVLM